MAVCLLSCSFIYSNLSNITLKRKEILSTRRYCAFLNHKWFKKIKLNPASLCHKNPEKSMKCSRTKLLPKSPREKNLYQMLSEEQHRPAFLRYCLSSLHPMQFCFHFLQTMAFHFSFCYFTKIPQIFSVYFSAVKNEVCCS